MKRVVVTGANKGIGLATVEVLAERGFFVFLGSRSLERGEAAWQTVSASTVSPPPLTPQSALSPRLTLSSRAATVSLKASQYCGSGEARFGSLLRPIAAP